MGKVLSLGITLNSGEKILEVSKIEVLHKKGIINDRHFSKIKETRNNITLIESENIDFYNSKSNTKIPYINFRRNIITKNIKLNELLQKKIKIGSVQILAYQLCKPCRYLQEMLGYNDIVKEFLLKGGLRCEILNDGTINVGDEISY